MRKTVIFLFHALVILVPLFFSSKTDELFEFNKIILTYLIAALILGAWVSRMILEKKWIFKRTPFDLPVVLFLVSQVIATIFSMHMRTSWFGYYSRFNGGLLSILTYVMLFYAFVSNIKRTELKSFLNSMLYGAFATALYAIPEHFGHSFSCSVFGHGFNDDCWIQDVRARVFGTFGQPNWLSAYMIMMIPVGIAFVLENWKRPLQAVLYSVFVASFFMTALFTGSRSGLFGLILGLILFAVLYTIYMLTAPATKQLAKGAGLKQALLPAGVMLIIFAVLFQVYGATFTPTVNATIEKLQHMTGLMLPRKALNQDVAQQEQRNATSSGAPAPGGSQIEVGGTESGVIRGIVWQGAIKIWQSSPKNFWIGSGVETFAYSYYLQRPLAHNMTSEWDFLYNKAHSEIINYLATTGILGTGTYLLMIGWVYVWTLLALRRHREVNPAFPIAWLAAYTGLHVSNFLGFSTVVVSILFYLVPAFILIDLNTENDQEKPRHMAISNKQIIGIGAVFLAVLYCLFVVITWWRADASYTKAKTFAQASSVVPSIQAYEEAIQLSPNEALFHDDYSTLLGNIAVGLAQQGEATQAAQFAQKAVIESDRVLTLNPVHLNFYKSRARLFITLASLDANFLTEADNTFTQAEKLAPTDPKLVYNQAVIRAEFGKTQEALALVQKALEMKPDYGLAITELEVLKRQATASGKLKPQAPILPVSPQASPVASSSDRGTIPLQ
ncbi:MAG TPA: tetratricopeptide repeat protein [Candidatus Saccharimonadia bacterium]|nr:tetratricopeptide repeat protein [Candidatus Saccharimonadia bacterium]